MIIGAHAILHSKDPDADRAFLRDVLRFPHVDVGGGWPIFGLPRPRWRFIRPRPAGDMSSISCATKSRRSCAR
jgi:hypothetical protein